jgi:hypothetical protein
MFQETPAGGASQSFPEASIYAPTRVRDEAL